MLNVVITPTLAYSSPISTYNTTIGSDKYTGSQFATYDISAGSVTISSTVTDKRGNTSAAATATITVIDYATPKVTKLVAERCNQNGTANAQGEYVKVSFAYTVSTLNGKNTLKYYLKYKKSTDTTYTEATNLVPTSGSYIFAADKSSSYDIIYGVQDDFHHITRTTSASTAMVLMHWKSDGTAMGVGKMVEESNLFDVGLPTRFFDKATFENDKSIFGTDVDGTICSALIPVSASGNTSLGYGLYNAKRGNTHLYGNKIQFYTNEGVYLNGNELYLNNDMRIYAKSTDNKVKNVFQGQNSNNNTVVGYGNYSEKVGNTNVYGYDVFLGVSNIASPGTYRPYWRQGASVDVVINTAGFVTNASKDVYFTIPFSRPIIGSPTVTVASTGSFILRQGNAYTHGSTATISATPTKYSVTADIDTGITIAASFSDITNVTNNSPIGVKWVGTITFS